MTCLWTKESTWRTPARRRWRPGLPSRRRCPWYKRGLSMTWTRGAALVHTRSLGFSALRWQRTPDYSPSPLPFQQWSKQSRHTHTASVVFEAQNIHSWYCGYRYTIRKRCMYWRTRRFPALTHLLLCNNNSRWLPCWFCVCKDLVVSTKFKHLVRKHIGIFPHHCGVICGYYPWYFLRFKWRYFSRFKVF